jgi:hypothetical protein
MDNIANLAALLRQTHGPFDKAAPKHDLWGCYAATSNAPAAPPQVEEASSDAANCIAGLGVEA